MVNSPDDLPTLQDLKNCFGLFSKDAAATCSPSLSTLRCDCGPCQRWQHFIEGHDWPDQLRTYGPPRPQYEVLNRDFLDALAAYLSSQLSDDDLLLEVGCGDGRLALALRKRLPKSIRVEASDSGALRLDERFPLEPSSSSKVEVEIHREDVQEAVRKRNPNFVLCSWMPLGHDWTETFRSVPSVRAYLLIGDQEICGLPWETWGRMAKKRDRHLSPSCSPYARAGFEMETLTSLSALQIGRTDTRFSCSTRSRTVIFRRTSSPEATLPDATGAGKRRRMQESFTGTQTAVANTGNDHQTEGATEELESESDDDSSASEFRSCDGTFVMGAAMPQAQVGRGTSENLVARDEQKACRHDVISLEESEESSRTARTRSCSEMWAVQTSVSKTARHM